MSERGPGPVILRRRLGKELRALREKADVSAGDAAQYIGVGRPTYGDTVPEWFRTYIGMESDADEILTYECEFIPGLLQTTDYAAAVRRAFWPELNEDDAQRSAAMRRDRQEHLLGNAAPLLNVVINEAVLHRIVGSPALMRAQLEHLVERAKLDHVRLQVLPFSAGANPGMNGAFAILQFENEELSTVYVEIEPGGLYPERPIDLARYRLVFGRPADLALAARKSAALIGRMAKQM